MLLGQTRQAEEEGNLAVSQVLKFQEPIVTWQQDLSIHDFSCLMSLSPCKFSASHRILPRLRGVVYGDLELAGYCGSFGCIKGSRLLEPGAIWKVLLIFEQTWANLTSVLGLNLDHLKSAQRQTAKERNESGPQQRWFHRQCRCERNCQTGNAAAVYVSKLTPGSGSCLGWGWWQKGGLIISLNSHSKFRQLSPKDLQRVLQASGCWLFLEP